MENLKRQDMQLHLNIVGWLHIVHSAILLLFGLFLFILLAGIGLASGDTTAVSILSIVGGSLGAFLLLLALPGLLAGIGLLTRKSWARILVIVVAVLGLFNIPIGTMIGVYTLWVMFQEESEDYFVSPTPA